MDFELSEDQQALGEPRTRPARRPRLTGTGASGRRSSVDPRRRLWAAMIEQGWLGVEQPESADGLGWGFVEVAVLLEELGATPRPAPFASTILALAALRGTEWEDRLANGAIGAVAWGDDRDRQLVPYAPIADVAVIVHGDSLVVHDLTAGERPTAEPAMDVTRCVGWIPTDRAGATRIDDAEAATALIDRGAAAVAAEALGGASTGPRPDRRARQDPRAVRPADRLVPGGEAPLRRHARRRRGHALDRLPRGLVAGRRRSRRLGRGVDGQGVVRRRGPSGHGARACRCTAASASRGSTTCTST